MKHNLNLITWFYPDTNIGTTNNLVHEVLVFNLLKILFMKKMKIAFAILAIASLTTFAFVFNAYSTKPIGKLHYYNGTATNGCCNDLGTIPCFDQCE